MKWQTLVPALGLVATLALPGSVEASHRHSGSCGHGYSGGSYGSSYSPYYRADYYHAPPPPAYYYRYYRPAYRPYYQPGYRPRPYYRPTSYFSLGIRF